MARIKIHTLHCILNVESDADEIYLKYDGKKIWPMGFYKTINSGEIKEVNEILDVTNPAEPAEIEVWDYDLLSSNDKIGSFTLLIGEETRGRFHANMKSNSETGTGSYLLEWEIIE